MYYSCIFWGLNGQGRKLVTETKLIRNKTMIVSLNLYKHNLTLFIYVTSQ